MTDKAQAELQRFRDEVQGLQVKSDLLRGRLMQLALWALVPIIVIAADLPERRATLSMMAVTGWLLTAPLLILVGVWYGLGAIPALAGRLSEASALPLTWKGRVEGVQAATGWRKWLTLWRLIGALKADASETLEARWQVARLVFWCGPLMAVPAVVVTALYLPLLVLTALAVFIF